MNSSETQSMSWLRSLRVREIILMIGFSLVGVLFTNANDWLDIRKGGLVLLMMFTYVLAVYALNSFADYEKDQQTTRLKAVSQVSKRGYLMLTIVAGLMFVTLATAINLQVLIFSASGFALWMLYYLPPIRLKSSFLAGTILHCIAGMAHFHTGYCSFSNISFDSATISLYFGLLLSTGHLNHEIMDYDEDKKTGNRTTTVRIGTRVAATIRSGIAFMALAAWCAAFITKSIDLTEFLIFLPASIALITTSIFFGANHPYTFQKFSRNLFLLSGLSLFVWKLVQNSI